VQRWLNGADPVRRWAAGDLDDRDLQRAGVFDYVIANLDRGGPHGHPNYLVFGRSLRLIDNGAAFPVPGGGRPYPMSSPFTAALAHGGAPPAADLLADVHAVDLGRLAKRLRAAGLPRRAVRLTVARIRAVRSEGTVTVPMFDAMWNEPWNRPGGSR
jgi:hypothetical protein